MTSRATAIAASGSNRGWIVTFAGTGINLALGVLYTWSVISKGVPAAWNWSETDKSLPYAIACLVFCLVMIPAGRLQDRIAPRATNPRPLRGSTARSRSMASSAPVGFPSASRTPPR